MWRAARSHDGRLLSCPSLEVCHRRLGWFRSGNSVRPPTLSKTNASSVSLHSTRRAAQIPYPYTLRQGERESASRERCIPNRLAVLRCASGRRQANFESLLFLTAHVFVQESVSDQLQEPRSGAEAQALSQQICFAALSAIWYVKSQKEDRSADCPALANAPSLHSAVPGQKDWTSQLPTYQRPNFVSLSTGNRALCSCHRMCLSKTLADPPDRKGWTILPASPLPAACRHKGALHGVGKWA